MLATAVASEEGNRGCGAWKAVHREMCEGSDGGARRWWVKGKLLGTRECAGGGGEHWMAM